MTVHQVSGNLFDNEYGAQALAHGCNCRGAMGAGIAVEFKKQYPIMYNQYKGMCDRHELELGDVYYWTNKGFTDGSQPDVFNIMIKDDWRNKADTHGLFVGLEKMKSVADQMGIHSIAIPRIGAGYGGLNWNEVYAIILIIFRDWSGDLFVYVSETKKEVKNESK